MRPARSSTLRCLEIVGWLSANGFMISDTSASPDARRARIARRVGSASAEKVNPRGSNCSSIAMWLYCHLAIYVSSEESSREAGYSLEWTAGEMRDRRNAPPRDELAQWPR